MHFKLLLHILFITNCLVLISSDHSGNPSESVESDNSNNNVENEDDDDDDACLINSNVAGKRIQGAFRVSESSVEYCAYLGIPYAQPPINELRFKPPQPTDFIYDLVSVYKSTAYPCISSKDFDNKTGIQSEDCLYLNIFIPLTVLRSNQKNAVVVWIHGGSYNVGSGLSDMHPTRGPESYVENDMIFVSFNYRLGPLGFLRVPELNITGNYGLMDQRFALAWVHQNIPLWNGDKNNITLMGWSAGSSSVSYHLLAAESNQYFNRAILMSGTLLNPWAQFDYPEVCLKQLLRKLQIKRRHVSRLLTINGTDFDRDLSVFFSFGANNFCFVPTVDHIVVGDTINYKLDKNIDVMIGWTSLESQHTDLHSVTVSRVFYTFSYLKFLNQTRVKLRRLSNYLENEFYNNTEKYFDATAVNWGTNETEVFYRLASKLISDMNLKYGSRNFVKNLQTVNGAEFLNIFVYQFSYDGKFFMNRKYSDGLEGAEHGDDLAYMYRTEQNLRGNKTNYDDDYKNELFVQRSLLKAWTNFMKLGNPTPVPIASSPNDIEESQVWENYKQRRHLLDINLQIKMVPDVDDAFYRLWTQIENCIRHDICAFLDECLHCV